MGGGWVEDKVYLPSNLKDPHFHVFQHVGNVCCVFFQNSLFKSKALGKLKFSLSVEKKKEKRF